MKKGELIALNAAFGKMTLPDVRMDDLYPILSAKADIGKEAELIEEKAATFQRETKPEGAGDFEISLADKTGSGGTSRRPCVCASMRRRPRQRLNPASPVTCSPRW